MKIAYVYDAMYPWVKGGAEKRVAEIAKRLAERGHEVHCYGLQWWTGEADIQQNGVFLHGLGKWPNMYNNGRRSIQEGVYFGLKCLNIPTSEFDIIDCQNFPYFSCFSAKFRTLNNPSQLVTTWHEVWGDYWYEYLGRKGIFGHAVEKITSRLTKNNVAVSQKTRRGLKNLGVDHNIQVIPNGIDFSQIQQIKSSQGDIDVIFAGRLIKEKNVDLLINAVSLLRFEMPDIQCYIIGDGPEKQSLEQLVSSLGLKKHITFIGFLERYEDMISYFKASKVFVLPSAREGFGIVVLEANACGLPVVTLRHERSAATDLIECKNGIICNTLSTTELAECIKDALSQKDHMEEYCVSYAQKYDWQNIVRLQEKYYTEL